MPTASTKTNGYSSLWVGIDGYSSSTVEQVGTEADVVNGKATYYAWYEMYPSDAVNISSITVNAGDSITASVAYVSNQFVLTISDNTDHENYTKSFGAIGGSKVFGGMDRGSAFLQLRCFDPGELWNGDVHKRLCDDWWNNRPK